MILLLVLILERHRSHASSTEVQIPTARWIRLCLSEGNRKFDPSLDGKKKLRIEEGSSINKALTRSPV
jgi:hypothetical protein